VKARLRLFGACACAIALSACASAPPKAEEPRPPGTGRVRVTVIGFQSERGQALVALFLSGKGWPVDETLAFGRAVLPIRGGEALAEFENVPSGPFAVSAFHDEDVDRVLDTGLLGIPSEDYGFSRDARGSFGPPSFEAARLELATGETKQLTIRVE
jgi:uncharacterized protein (DUF2141 family)